MCNLPLTCLSNTVCDIVSQGGICTICEENIVYKTCVLFCDVIRFLRGYFCSYHQVADDGDEHDQTVGQSKKTGRRKPAYSGGLVLDPKRG